MAIFFIATMIIVSIATFLVTTYIHERPVYFENDYNFIFDKPLIEEMNEAFEQTVEYSACLEGEIIGEDMDDVYFYYMNKVQTGTEDQVDMVLCNSLGAIHSHPNTGCSKILNSADAQAAKNQFRNGVSFFLIQCEENTFEVYTRENLFEGKIIETN